MLAILFFLATCLSIVIFLSSAQLPNYEVHYQWNQVEFNFPSDSIRTEMIANGGSFIPLNCAPTGLKIYNDLLFLAVPRARPGVPSTLNVVPYKKSIMDQILKRNQGPKLTPFPSWEMQKIGNCNALQQVPTMETDAYDRLWIVDMGKINILEKVPQNKCPPKIVIYDLLLNKIERIYQFPNNVVPQDTSLIKDIQVACYSREDCYCYISNINIPYQIIIYDYENNDSWSATHPSMKAEMDQANITIDGVPLMVPLGIAGLGLTPKNTNYSVLYFSKIAGDHIYSVKTDILRDGTTLKRNPNLKNEDVKDFGRKPMRQGDGGAMDNLGRWYFGSLPESSIWAFDTNWDKSTEISERSFRAVQSAKDMQWPDTLSFDNNFYLAFTTTRYHL